jgi:F5/8 type C domain-containing protein/type IX secretion system substrate protein/fibronectin type III domain protein
MKHPYQRIALLLISVTFYISHVKAQVNVVTQHYDLGRTGWYNKESLLNKGNVRQGSFGKLFTRAVDDQLYAQPLIVQGVNISGVGKKNIVYLATVNNTVYAYDADSANVTSPYWQANLTPSGSRPIVQNDLSGACGGNFQSNIGIVGTPVIDTISNTIYLVARSINPSTVIFSEYLHALDIRTGAEKSNSPVLIQAQVNGTGDGNVSGVVHLDPERNNQRPGLLLLNGVVYIGFSSHCDWGPYHGWILGYDATTLQQKFVYNDTPDGYNGGIWMSGTGIAADSAGNIYFATGNGSVGVGTDPTNLRNRSESVIRMNPTDAVQPVKDFFTPNNFPVLEASDLDLGTSAAMLIPGAGRTVTGCKDGNIYLVDQANMGGYNSLANQNLQTIDLGNNANMHAQFTYYRGTQNEFAYFWPENTALKAIPFNRSTGLFNAQNIVTSGVQGPVGQTGAMMSVSSNGSVDSTAVLWASYPGNCDGENYNCPGILLAFDALDVTKQLWSSGTLSVDNPGNFAKFNSPVIANGKVYLGTFSNQLIVYGLQNLVADTCNGSDIALNKPAFASSVESNQLPASAAFDGNSTTRWSSAFSDPQYIYVDLGKRYDICSVNIQWETALGQNFQIQIADDTANWKTLANITNNISLTNSIPLQGTGRYVRLLGTVRGTVYGYSIYEFEVYGKESAVQCAPPEGLSVKNIYETSATLQWLTNGADSFNVQYKTVNDVSWHSISTNQHQITLNGLICGTDYFFNVQAICSSSSASLVSSNTGFSTLPCASNCGLLPSRWSSQDIGATAIAGSACYSNGTFTIHASGNDIWDVADQFHFAYAVLTGDGSFIARVNTLDNSNPWNKCGIMFRETLDPGSRHALIALTSGNGSAFQYRQFTDGTSTNTNAGAMTAPYWIKLVKSGSVYTAFSSPDSVSWTQVGAATDVGFGANSPVYCGLALTSHDNTILSTATIDHFSSTGFTEFQLLSFTGELISPQLVKLSWTTALELNTDYFIVEKSTDNLHFSAIDSVPAADGGRFMENYTADDNSPDSGINYYHLKMVDILGNYKYSQLVMVRLTNSNIPTIGPNPSNSTVTIIQGTDAIQSVNFYDFLGRRVIGINNSSNSPALTLSVYNLPKGVYVVEIRTTNDVFRKKLLKR